MTTYKKITILPVLLIAILFLTGSFIQTPSANKGIWISPDEIAHLPMTGKAWKKLKKTARSDWGVADFSTTSSRHNIKTLAGALVAARTGDKKMREKTIAALRSAMQSSPYRTLELARMLQTYIIAADIIGYRDPEFKQWVREMIFIPVKGHSKGKGVIGTAERSANNWGGHSRASAIAGALYLEDIELLKRLLIAHQAFIGIPARGNKLVLGDTNWHAGNPISGVNVRGATINGVDVSGVLPEDWRRGGKFVWPPNWTVYMWEGMQGFVVSAVLLHRAGVLHFSAGDDAVVRAVEILYKGGIPPEGDDTWIPWVVNYYGKTHFPTTPARSGKNIGWTDWMLQH